MRREIVVCLLTTALLSIVPFAEAQQPKKVYRIGILSPDAISVRASLYEAFRQGLRELGYLEGQNLSFEWRSAEGKLDRLPDLAAELVRIKVDVIVTTGTPAAEAAKNATRTVPIVMQAAGDPVVRGLVASLGRPGGNITGMTSITLGLTGKRLELLKEIVSGLSRVAVLRDPDYPQGTGALKEVEVAAGSLGLKLQFLGVRRSEDFESVFQAATKARAQGLIHFRHPIIIRGMRRIAELAVKNRLPAVYDDREFVDAGGLMSYGTNLADVYRRLATYVDKILKGTKPADLPMQQPMKFELVINLKTAKQIGLTIPQSVLYRADKVIK